MSRIQFYCPNCETPETPVLIATPFYNCPECKQITPREKLTSRRIGKIHLAGTTGFGFSFTNAARATLYDSGQATDTYTTPGFGMISGDTVVVGVVSFGGAEITNPPTVALVGVGAMTTIEEAGADGTIFVGLYSGNGAGNVSVSVAFGGLPNPISSAMFVTKIRRSSTPNVDKSNIAYSASATLPASGSTGVLASSPQAVIAFVGAATRTSSPTGTWLNPFFAAQRTGTDTGANDCVVYEGRYETNNTSAIEARVSFPSAVEVGCGVVTVRA
jgi:hypothetical protein